MHDFLDRHHLSKLNIDQVNNLNRPINPREIQVVIKSFQTKKSPESDDFSTDFQRRARNNTSQTISQN